MFTGLVQEVGSVRQVRRTASGAALWIDAPFDDLVLGESVAVDGACLTVKESDARGFLADASTETLAKTTLGDRRRGDRVHLERALRLGDRLGGHMVTGHVDGVGRMVLRSPLGDTEKVVFEVPADLAPYLAPKGSVAVDGVSLTVNGVQRTRFDVVLVPFTLTATTFAARSLGSRVNIETDVLAKYVARLIRGGA
jgi:riboflavin synthase